MESLHDEGVPAARPMPDGQAIREQAEIRAVAVADGPTATASRLHALSDPVRSADGCLTGAVNMLIDVTDEQADLCYRRHALPPPRQRHL